MRRRSALAKVLAPAVAAALFGSAAIIGGCGDDDDAVPGPTGSITVSLDGAADVTVGGPSGYGSIGAYYTSASGPVPPLSTGVLAGSFGSAPVMIVTFDGSSTGIFNVGAGEAAVGYTASVGEQYNAAGGPAGGSGTVTVTTYGVVGERIEGTFNVTAFLWDLVADMPTTTQVNLTGSFSVVRLADDFAFGP